MCETFAFLFFSKRTAFCLNYLVLKRMKIENFSKNEKTVFFLTLPAAASRGG